jgi:hypothetical protein
MTGESTTRRARLEERRDELGEGAAVEEAEMTTDEFVETIKAGTGRIPLPGGGSFDIQRDVRHALGDALPQILPKGIVVSGVELARLEYRDGKWKGAAELLLLLDKYVAHVKGTLPDGTKRRASVTHQLYPLTALERVSVVTTYETEMAQTDIRSVQLEVSFGDTGLLKATATLPDAEVKHVLAFAQQLLAAPR